MRLSLLLAVLAVGAIPASAQTVSDHSTFDVVLQKHVYGSLVDYASLKADRAALDHYIQELSNADFDALAEAATAVQLAFWINAYNACALKLVIDHYPIKKASFPASLVRSLQGVPANSIRQIPNTWDGRFCPVAGSERSLDEIEHEIIRPMGDPRIHFAVNCASRSCPVLARQAYTSDALDDQLDAAVHRFVSDTAQQYRVVRRGDRHVLRVNKILDWYKDDFGGTQGVLVFLRKYVSEDHAALLEDPAGLRVEYYDYDWTLNDTAVFGSGSGS